MGDLITLPPDPKGWYCVGFSHELPAGALITRRFMGQDLVIFRTKSGVPAAMDAYCPHLGAHFGHRGSVVGETLRCPFHNFCFNVEGVCISTGYNTKPPPTARADTRPVCEINGLVRVYHDPQGAPPAWEIPPLDSTGWTGLYTRCWPLNSHPQETTENSVDIGHLKVVHGYHAVESLNDLKTDGPYLNARYAITRPALRWLPASPTLRAEFEIHIYGLGYSFVDVRVVSMGLHTRQFVLPTPTEDGRIDLRIALSMKRLGRGALALPARLVNGPAARFVFEGFAEDVQQDFIIWEHKRYIHPPALAQGDGPIGAYRRWARQFYADRA
jgi:nitrite reductase/ring-hydroxylating ferredoxin subunit